MTVANFTKYIPAPRPNTLWLVCHPLGVVDGRFDLVVPEGAALGVLVLHPHPDHGGDRFNPVVQALFDAAVAEGWAAIRFDFSTSDLGRATAEAADALGRLPGDLSVVAAGYSFGAAVATQVHDVRIDRWVLVAPPLGSLPIDTAAIASDARPKLVLSPAHDQFCPPSTAVEATAGWTSTTVEPVEGADHFLAGSTARVAARAIDFIRSR
jgi:uncharacterized protein